MIVWFAWYPVKTDQGWRWFCKVERRAVFDDYGLTWPYDAMWHYEHRAR